VSGCLSAGKPPDRLRGRPMLQNPGPPYPSASNSGRHDELETSHRQASVRKSDKDRFSHQQFEGSGNQKWKIRTRPRGSRGQKSAARKAEEWRSERARLVEQKSVTRAWDRCATPKACKLFLTSFAGRSSTKTKPSAFQKQGTLAAGGKEFLRPPEIGQQFARGGRMAL
jgi:hypothetical protein